MSEHTQGRLEVSSSTIIADEKGRVIAQCAPIGIEGFDTTIEEAQANAERLVMAWNSHEKLIADNKRLKEALNKIAYEPIGATDASSSEVLQGCVDIAKQTLNESETKDE